ncbi:MAG: hypothetical protein OEY64_09685 [Nitrospinota bacterium]|nr:hypothetical protein [Nitrospinota bacterium]
MKRNEVARRLSEVKWLAPKGSVTLALLLQRSIDPDSQTKRTSCPFALPLRSRRLLAFDPLTIGYPRKEMEY